MRRLLYLAIIILLFTPHLAAFAEITSPYTVDEKSKVLFGDSTVAGEYEGLQNYSYDYIDGYLHITFTYTHHGCCFASYPPRLYITSTDPRATTTLEVRDQREVYPLLPQPTHLTDWYQYNVQFNDTGYTVKVRQATTTEILNEHKEIAGLATTDWAALANLFPTQDGITDYSMAFTPLPIYQVVNPTPGVATTTPVIIVPGIASSYLNGEGGEELWLSLPRIVASVTDSHLDELSLNSNGEEISVITSSAILRKIGSHSFFEDLFVSLESIGYVENESLYEFPYDWRVDVEVSASSLKNKIDQIKEQRGVEKVNLIAHSMGGLLVKKYLKEYGGNDLDIFIDIGTPHNGSPKSFKILVYGDNFGFEKFGLNLLNPTRVKNISQNMPSVYQLLPSEEYFDEADPNYRYYVFNGVNGNDRLTYEETKDYLIAEGRNGGLIERADELHQEIDGLNPADYGVETYNFVGCGVPTIGQFYVLDEDDGHYTYNIKMINGDGTVPVKSAEAMLASSTIYVRGVQHAVMPSASGVRETIAAILTATSTETLDISQHANLAFSSGDCSVPNGKIVSFHSPIDLHVYDQSGNHVGPSSNGDIEYNIEGVVYEVIGDNKFAYLPEGMEFVVKGSATDSGLFDVRIQEMVDGDVTTTTLYSNIALASTTQAEFVLGATLPSVINLDHDSDGVYEDTHPVSTSTAGILNGTGELPEVVPTLELEVKASGSLAQFTRVSEEFITPATTTATTSVLLRTEEELIEIIPDNEDKTAAAELNVVKEVDESEDQKIEEVYQYENTAVVYKSLGYKVKIFLKSVWGWFKSWWGW